MFVATFVQEITDVDPDFPIAYIDRENLEVVTFLVETAPTLQIETPSVPVAGEDAVPNGASSQRVTHVRTLVISGVYSATHVEERNRTSFLQFYSLGFAQRDFAQACDASPFRDRFDHGCYSSRGSANSRSLRDTPDESMRNGSRIHMIFHAELDFSVESEYHPRR